MSDELETMAALLANGSAVRFNQGQEDVLEDAQRLAKDMETLSLLPARIRESIQRMSQVLEKRVDSEALVARMADSLDQNAKALRMQTNVVEHLDGRQTDSQSMVVGVAETLTRVVDAFEQQSQMMAAVLEMLERLASPQPITMPAPEVTVNPPRHITIERGSDGKINGARVDA